MNEKLHKKVSPRCAGGGRDDWLSYIYSIFFPDRGGWFIDFFLPLLAWKAKTSLTGNALNSSDHYLGTSPLLLRLSYGTCNWVWWKSAQSTTPAGISICIIIKKWSGHPSFKRRGNVSGIYSILYILFWTKLSHYFTIFNSVSWRLWGWGEIKKGVPEKIRVYLPELSHFTPILAYFQ